MDVYGLSPFHKHYSKQNVKPNAKTSKYSPGLLLKHIFPKLFESLFQVPLRKTRREKLIITLLICRTYTVQFFGSSYALERKRDVAERPSTRCISPGNAHSLWKWCISHRSYDITVGAKGHCHCQCCRVPHTPHSVLENLSRRLQWWMRTWPRLWVLFGN